MFTQAFVMLLGLSARTPWGGGVLSPGAVRRTCAAVEARRPGRPKAVGAADAKHP